MWTLSCAAKMWRCLVAGECRSWGAEWVQVRHSGEPRSLFWSLRNVFAFLVLVSHSRSELDPSLAPPFPLKQNRR